MSSQYLGYVHTIEALFAWEIMVVLEASALHTASNLEIKYDILHCRENIPLFILTYLLFKP